MRKKLYTIPIFLGVFLIVLGIYFFTTNLNEVVGALLAWGLAVRIIASLINLVQSKKTSVEVTVQLIIDFIMFVILVLFGYATFGHALIEPKSSLLSLTKMFGYWLICTAIEIIIVLVKAYNKISKDRGAYYIVSCALCFLIAFFLIFGQDIGLKFVDENFLSYLIGIASIIFGVLFITRLLHVSFSSKLKNVTIVKHIYEKNDNQDNKDKKETSKTSIETAKKQESIETAKKQEIENKKEENTKPKVENNENIAKEETTNNNEEANNKEETTNNNEETIDINENIEESSIKADEDKKEL